MERHNSSDDQPSRRPSNPNLNVFDDEFALDPDENDFMPSVSDGFRPMNTSDRWDGDRQDHDRNDQSQPQFTTPKTGETDLRRIATRNSTTKVPGMRESMSHDSRHPGTHNRGPSSQANPLQHRESISSTGSFATMARSESPLGTGPSHPYGMYPQNTMARSSSIATTSTQRQPHRSMSLQQPTHPYAMYSQNVIDDESPMPQVPQLQTAIPVGFPGLNGGYHRQIGPDGEEQDIIGPDGHTEQLPPYSRYPEEGPTKAALAAEASATPVDSVPNPFNDSNAVLLPPASPVSPLSTPLTSVTPARLPPQRPETQTGNLANATSVSVPAPPSNSASASLLSTENDISEKAEPARSVRSTNWRKKKLWGKVPMGVALILLVLVLIFAIILGAAIGTFVAKKDKPDKGGSKHEGGNREDPASQINGPNPTLFDASPIPTPSDLPPLPTGSFALPLGIPQESSPGCLTQANQYSAWSCKMTFAPLVLSINNTSIGNNGAASVVASVTAYQKPDGGIQYGLQPPTLNVQTLQLVTDWDYKAYGAAWHFATRYDKVVVLNPEEFGAGASLRKRQDDKPSFRHRFQVMPGDFPWLCVWNQTYIEGYIYAYDNSSAATLTAFPTAFPSNQFGSTIPVETGAPPTGVPPNPSIPTSEVTPTPSPLSPRGDGDYPRIPPYPRIVKIEERRLPNSPQPYCQKMILLDNGQLAPAPSGNEGPITVFLQEEDPSFDEFYQQRPQPTSTQSVPTPDSQGQRRSLEKRRDPSDACHCQWMFQ